MSSIDPGHNSPVAPRDAEGHAIRVTWAAGLPASPTADEFGVPSSLLGIHPEEFYGAVGRVICLTALLEDRLLALLLAIRRAPRSKYVKKPVSEILKELRSDTTSPFWVGFADYLDRAEKAIAFRNDIAHNLWPAQGDGTVFGHRPDRGEGGLTGKSKTMTTDMARIRDHIAVTVDLLSTWQTWFTAANAPDRADVASAASPSRPAVAGSPGSGGRESTSV